MVRGICSQSSHPGAPCVTPVIFSLSLRTRTAGDASDPRLWVSLAGIRSGYPGRFCTEPSLQVPLGGGRFRGRDCAHRRERERTGERFGDAGATRHAWRRRGAVRSCLLCIATRGRLSINGEHNGEAQWGCKRPPAMEPPARTTFTLFMIPSRHWLALYVQNPYANKRTNRHMSAGPEPGGP